MVFRIDFRKYLFDISLAVYDERGAQNTHVFTTHELLLPPYAVGGSDGFVGIGYQRELQPVFVGNPRCDFSPSGLTPTISKPFRFNSA